MGFENGTVEIEKQRGKVDYNFLRALQFEVQFSFPKTHVILFLVSSIQARFSVSFKLDSLNYNSDIVLFVCYYALIWLPSYCAKLPWFLGVHLGS